MIYESDSFAANEISCDINSKLTLFAKIDTFAKIDHRRNIGTIMKKKEHVNYFTKKAEASV